MKLVSIKRADGQICIGEIWNDASQELILSEAQKLVAGYGYVSHREIRQEDVPVIHREFRNAWEDSGTEIFINMVKAKEIHKNKLRALRKPKLEALDIEYQRADESGDVNKKQEIALKKKELRNVTQLTLPNTPEELKNFIPDILK
jgi:hypothetical protein